MKVEDGDTPTGEPGAIDPDAEEIDFFGIAFDFESTEEAETVTGLLNLEKIGPYLIERSLGKGGFGEVFLAHDESLQRKVAIKVIKHGAFGNSDDQLLEEGQVLARLSHPGIVKVHSAGKWEGQIYFVSEYLEGKTVSEVLEENDITIPQAVRLAERIAEALDYAHRNDVIHRDIKPNNIIVTPEGQPVLIDFGIALTPGTQEINQSRGIFGTAAYMSPEQARGEGHLVDGRTDIYSLGVILYGLLTGKTPFEGNSVHLIEQVSSFSLAAPDPRSLNPEIPRALERICLKALSKRPGDRYETAAVFAHELNTLLLALSPESPEDITTVKQPIVPKGLRSFDSQDAGFFLQLLPGVKDRAGVPDSIRFWQKGIENPVDPFRVGVLYGPSGSGKSSFLKAGLVPLLSTNVEVISVAADVSDTELALTQRLKNRFPELAEATRLDECIRAIRESHLLPAGNKLLIIVDQFEQWLHARRPDSDVELISALRQCDGFKIQFILTLRDEFWMGIGKLMEEIEVPLLQTTNCAALDLFDIDHARKVLIKFGYAYNRLSSNTPELPRSESKFIESALSELSQNGEGKIVPVQLSLFADMTRELSWSGDTLKKLGGVAAIGSKFLESTFTERKAAPTNRMLVNKARAILEPLLPEGGILIRKPPISESNMRERAGFEPNDPTFDSTLLILERELRLIALVDNELLEERDLAGDRERYFQLTHDYLVPFLRDWVYETKRSTARGRAALRLAELSDLYQRFPGNGHLPTFPEWIRFASLTRRSEWTDLQRRMMSEVSKRIGVWAVLVLVALTLAIVITDQYRRDAASRQLFAEYVESPTPVATNLMPRLSQQRDKFQGLAEKEIHRHREESREWLNLAAFLLSEHPDLRLPLFERGLSGTFEEFEFVINRLTSDGKSLPPELWERLAVPTLPSSTRLRLAATLATLSPESENWEDWGDETVRLLVAQNSSDVVRWLEFFRPVRHHLIPALDQSFGNWLEKTADVHTASADYESPESITASRILSDFHSDQSDSLLGILDKASPKQLRFILEQIKLTPSFPVELLKDRLASPLAKPEDSSDPGVIIRAKAILALAEINDHSQLWKSINWEPGQNNRLRSWLIYLSPKAGMNHHDLLDQLQNESSPSIISAVILMLGDYDSDAVSFKKPQVEQQILTLFTTHPDSKVHASARWLLGRWGWGPIELDQMVKKTEPPTGANWHYNRNGHAMIQIELPKSSKGPHNFEIAMLETTLEQYQAFRPNFKQLEAFMNRPEHPTHLMSAETGMAYCNWLSEKEGYDQSELCYESYTSGNFKRWRPVDNHYEKKGFRLPSLEEFYFSACGNIEGEWHTQSQAVWLKEYAWFLDNSGGRAHPTGLLKPTGFGLNDAIGNLLEWCQRRTDDAYLIIGATYRSPRWSLRIDANAYTLPDSTLPFASFRIARTLNSD